MIEEALRQDPSLSLDVQLVEGSPYYHGNYVIADRGTRQAEVAVGTAYFWSNQQSNSFTPSYERGVVLSGDDAQVFIQQADHMRRTTASGEPVGR